MHTIHRAIIAGLCVVLAPLATRPLRAQEALRQVRDSTDSTQVTPAAVVEGRRLFHGRGTCFTCHGAQLEGSPMAPTLRAHKWRDAKNGELAPIFDVVTHGVPGTLMVSHPGGISDGDAARLAAYVWSVNHHGTPP